MKAFINKIDEETGREILGSIDSRVSNDYKTLSSLRRYAFKNLEQGIYRVKVYYNWDKKYGKADVDFLYKKRS